MEHELKCAPEYFQLVVEGRKTFEIRLDDRGFQEGDSVVLMEYKRLHPYASEKSCYTGRSHRAQIGCVTDFKQRKGYVVFALLPTQ